MLDGCEKKDYVGLRAYLYEILWSMQEQELQVFPIGPPSFFQVTYIHQEVLQKSNVETIENVVGFIDNIDFEEYATTQRIQRTPA